MYATHPAPRYLLIFGLFGLAVLTPPKDLYPTWFVMSLILAPLVLLEFGAALEDEASGAGRFRIARWFQISGAASYALSLGILMGLRGPTPDQNLHLGLGLAGIGALAALAVLRAGLAWRLGEAETTSRVWSMFDGVVIATLICLAFVVVEIFLFIKSPELAASPKRLAGLFFFGGGFVLLGSQLLTRLRFRRGGDERLKRLSDLAQLLGLLGLAVGFLVMSSDEEISSVMRVLLAVGGGLLGLGGGWMAARRLFGLPSGLSYHAVREGLLEKSRRHVLLYPWSVVLEASLGELHGNTALFVRLAADESSPTVIWRRKGTPEKLRQKRQKSHRTSLAFTGAELVIMEVALDGDLAVLFRQIQQVFGSEENRQALPQMELSLLHPQG